MPWAALAQFWGRLPRPRRFVDMSPKRSKEQVERIKKAHKRATGRVVSEHGKSGRIGPDKPRSGKHVLTQSSRSYGADLVSPGHVAPADEQPRPKVPLLSGGSDPTLGKRFEEELYRS